MASNNNSQSISEWIQQYERGELSPFELGQRVLHASIPSDGSVMIDRDRQRRCGFPEVVYGAGKSVEAIQTAVTRLLEAHNDANHPEVLVTRVIPEQVRCLSEVFPWHRWNHRAGTFRVGRDSTPRSHDALECESGVGRVAVVSAGTTDEPIALEAIETLAWMGVPSKLIQDVGVAGPYRLLAQIPELQTMAAIVCVAGMEGALPSVLGGYVGCPVIAVPTSVGYGANFAGLSALLSMLNACASNIAVVNIDSGFKGAYMAGLIATR
jgi:NCAIR mutase (PurE)-related protein